MSKLKHINKMASPYRHATLLTNINHNLFICILVSLLLPTVNEGSPSGDDGGRRLTREYHLRQGALRGLIVKPSRQYDLQNVEMFLGIPYAAPPVANLRFMPPVTAPLWPGVKMATRFAPVCPQMLPPIRKGNPPSLGRQNYRHRLEAFLKDESEDCLYLNIYVPYREQKFKKFPVLVFIHGDSFEFSSGNPYDGRVLASYGNIMVVTVNYRLGILGFMKPSLTDHDYGNNGLLDQLAALQWIKDNIEDLNGDPHSVTIMGHGTGAACVNFLMLSPISNGLFHRAILMSGSALSDWAMTRDPAQYTLQVAQSLGCNPGSKNMMACLQNKPLSEIKRIQILARDFETPLGPVVAGSFIPSEPSKTMESFPHLLSKYQLLLGVTELESYHDFGVIELDHGVLENQRDEFITKYAKIVFDGAEDISLKEILKHYATSKTDPQRWSVETNRDVILNAFSDARTLAPMIRFANYQSQANRQSYFYVFGHNSVSTDYASLNKSVHGEELPYILGVPLGGTNSHFHTEYTQKEKLLSEVIMRLWTNFVKIGTPNTQSENQYYSMDRRYWKQYNVEWPEYNVDHQSFLRLDIPPSISSYYRSNYSKFWIETLPNKMRRYVVDPLFEYTPAPTTSKPKSTSRNSEPRRIWHPAAPPIIESPHYTAPAYGRLRPYSPPAKSRPDPDMIYREIQAMKTPNRPIPHGLMDKPKSTTEKQIIATMKHENNIPAKTSGATISLIVSIGILFLAANMGICAILYYKKRKLRSRDQTINGTNPRAELGDVDVIGQKSMKDDKSAIQTLKNSCSVIKSMSFNKIRNNNKITKKSKPEPCKTPKSDDSGGFRERFQLRRHLSTSTLDAHTKVRDWIANEVMHRCSPSILRKSNSELNNDKQLKITRSEELLSDSKRIKKDTLNVDKQTEMKSSLKSKKSTTVSNKTKTSEKTTSTSALGSHSSIASNKQSMNSVKQSEKSCESLKSKGTESMKSKKVSVAIDATPAARTCSILQQEPIEITKSFDCTDGAEKHSKSDKTLDNQISNEHERTENPDENRTFTSVVNLSLGQDKSLKISHKHSTSDPVTDINYDKIVKQKMNSATQATDILPPVSFRNEINVTSKDENTTSEPLTAAESLLTIQRRNFPKVLPDLPKSQKRLSLQPTSLQSFRSFAGSTENQCDMRLKVPPQPPPRTTTLERRIAYRNTKSNLSSFDTSNSSRIPEHPSNLNYENIDSLSPPQVLHSRNRSFDSTLLKLDKVDKSPSPVIQPLDREYPKVIIQSSSDGPSTSEPKIFIVPSPSQVEISNSTPRVRLPDDFHTNASGSITSFSSFCSDDDDDDDFAEDIDEDKLLQELVGSVDSPTDMEDILDTKGPDRFIRKLEIVPVKINPGQVGPRNHEDYVFVSDLLLPDVSGFERTAQIKPNFGLNKLTQRSESIHKPPEKAVKLKQKRSMKPASIMNRKSKDSRKSSHKKIEHSNSGSSNDTETSTGTVIKRSEVKKV
ncbi:hypothetical protein JYU34_011556 [Plutella xylostella]|uniref:Carboxylesterase type B domain-containing protein n=1 Tax=Plutella xylostella TaxID=51655 RepID=A0ABQ7QH86_PLUXY|nr:hypothetical protein JYU34_011556 [Plutella xylostella]